MESKRNSVRLLTYLSEQEFLEIKPFITTASESILLDKTAEEIEAEYSQWNWNAEALSE